MVPVLAAAAVERPAALRDRVPHAREGNVRRDGAGDERAAAGAGAPGAI